MKNASEIWFGNSFSKLHPLLQNLHTNGGTLNGPVEISFGHGIAGIFGKRIAKKLGVPVSGTQNTLTVDIKHSDTQLFWNRSFNNSQTMKSVFVPCGNYSNGYWTENTSALSLQLQVEVIDGGWHWIQKKISFRGIPLPLCLAPKTVAYKTIIDNKYVFSVTVSAPLLGKMMNYSGKLTAI